MQLQWLRYVSICRPVERHQFIIIALNRPAPCTPTPSHSILPSIVQFRFYAVIALFSHRLRHFSSLLPLPLFRFKRSNFRFLALLLFSLFSFLSFFFFTSPFHSTRYIHVVPRCLLHANTFIFLVTLFTNENPLLLRSVSPYLVPLALSLHRSLSPPLLHLLLAIAHHPFCFLRRFVDRGYIR